MKCPFIKQRFRRLLPAAIYLALAIVALAPTPTRASQISDVMDVTPHARDIGCIAQAGIATGYANGTFHPMTEVARQNMTAFLHRLSVHVVAHRATERADAYVFGEDRAVHIGPPDFFSSNCNYREHARWRRRRTKLTQVTMR